MRNSILMAAMVLLAASCSNESVENLVENNANQPTAPVRVSVNDFSMSMSEVVGARGFTRSEVDPATYNGVGAMTLAFYNSEGTEVYKSTQIKNDGSTFTTFGSFSANLPIGTYTMVALGYTFVEGDGFRLTSSTEAAFTTEKPRETFCATQDVTVTSTTPLDLDVTLNRIVAALDLFSTDGRSASATKIRTTFAKGGKAFNPTTGLATSDVGFSQVNNPSAAVGATINVRAFPFLTTDEETMDVTIEALDADDNVLFTKVVNNVPFKRNYITKLRGAIYTASTSAAAFKIETSWGTGETVNF